MRMAFALGRSKRAIEGGHFSGDRRHRSYGSGQPGKSPREASRGETRDGGCPGSNIARFDQFAAVIVANQLLDPAAPRAQHKEPGGLSLQNYERSGFKPDRGREQDIRTGERLGEAAARDGALDTNARVRPGEVANLVLIGARLLGD